MEERRLHDTRYQSLIRTSVYAAGAVRSASDAQMYFHFGQKPTWQFRSDVVSNCLYISEHVHGK